MDPPGSLNNENEALWAWLEHQPAEVCEVIALTGR